MTRTTDYEFLAPESTVGAIADRDAFAVDAEAYADPGSDDVFDGLASDLYDEGVEHEVRNLLGRVFGI